MPLRVGEIYRYLRLSDAKADLVRNGTLAPIVDGLPNLLAITIAPSGTFSSLESGINPIAVVRGSDGPRVPAVLISTSPHKAGSETTPWQDHFDPDIGYARYFGDAKPAQNKTAEQVTGNKSLLAQLDLHRSSRREDRARAAPIVLFKAVPHDGRVKGQRVFQGFGVLLGAERVVQRDTTSGRPFTNYRFECCILDMSAEHEEFSWDWINARRDPLISSEETLHLAPESWRRWVDDGIDGVDRLRRRVATLQTVKKAEQIAEEGSPTATIRDRIHAYFEGRKHNFEALAEQIVKHVMVESGIDYRAGWITSRSSDGGADFVGRIDIGSGLARTRLVVLGQAKCVMPSTAISGEQIARVVARLRRGWIGVFVTTGHYSVPAQREVIEDQYPIMLINGTQVAESVQEMMHIRGITDVEILLDEIDSGYEERVRYGSAEEILLDD